MLFRLFSEGSHKLNEALQISTTSQHTHCTTVEKQVKQNLDFAALLVAELGSWLQVVGCSTRAAESSPVEFGKLLLSDEPWTVFAEHTREWLKMQRLSFAALSRAVAEDCRRVSSIDNTWHCWLWAKWRLRRATRRRRPTRLYSYLLLIIWFRETRERLRNWIM